MSSGNKKTLRFDNARIKWRLVEQGRKQWLHFCSLCNKQFFGGVKRKFCGYCTDFNQLQYQLSSGQRRALRLVTQAVSSGALPSLHDSQIKCADCDRKARCYDHRDYSKPLEVTPVCYSCNMRRGPASSN